MQNAIIISIYKRKEVTMKKNILSLVSACVIAVNISGLKAFAYSADTDYAHGGYSYEHEAVEVDWSLWEDFLKYDLRITDYDSLSENKKMLCEFIYETEMASDEDIVCERARRIVMGYDVGERVTLYSCEQYERIADYAWDYHRLNDNSYAYKGVFTLHCVPDIKHIGENNYNEYWLDDEGTERIEALGEGMGFVLDNFNGTYRYVRSDGVIETLQSAEDFLFQNIRSNGMEFTVYPDHTVCLSKIADKNILNNDTLSVPERVQGMYVTRIGSEVFDGANLKEIKLPETIKYIEPASFKNCKNLEKINFPSGLEYIGDYAFIDCPSLKNIKLSCPKVKNSYIFSNCTIKNLNINTKTVPYYPDMNTIEKITFGNNVNEIDINYLVNKYSVPSHIKIISGTYPITKNVTIPKNIEILGAFPDITPIFFGSGVNTPPEIPLIDDDYCIFDKKVTVSGYNKTEAQEYAKAHGIKFNSIDKTEKKTTTTKTTKAETTTKSKKQT